jgi:phosphonate transport system ATP-binding protein
MLHLQGAYVRHPSASLAALPGDPQWALADITIKVAPGEQVAIIGPSGAGKTTLLHTLAASQGLQQGHYELFGQPLWQLPKQARHKLRRQLFLAPQTPPLPARQRVVTAVLAGMLPQWSLWRSLRNLVKPVAAQAAFDALSRFDLQHKLYARVDHLSGGERQRCALARLLVSDARLLLVDEPLSALDPTLAKATLTTLQQEAASRGATLVCSLHQVELACGHFGRIIGLREGKIMFDSSNVTAQMLNELYASCDCAALPGINPDSAPQALAAAQFEMRCF